MKALMPVIVLACLGGSFVGAGGLNPRPAPTVTSTALDTAMGRVLKAYRTTFGLSQSGLAALTCFPAPCTPTVSASKISRIERGLDSGTTAQQDSLVRALDREFHRQFDAQTEARLTALILRNRR